MKEKYGSFDDIIKTAKEIEQNTYDIGKDDSLFFSLSAKQEAD